MAKKEQLYVWPFADAVKANVASVMCSYNKFNTTWACESKSLLTTLLKDELDFQGYVMSGACTSEELQYCMKLTAW
jgi:beta-glucosidase